MAITTISGHVQRAIDFYKNNSNLFIGAGNQTPWEDEEHIPSPLPSITELSEFFGMKRISVKYLVVPSDSGTIRYSGQNFEVIGLSDAIPRKCRWVYVEASFDYDEIPLKNYGSLGVFLNPTFKPGVDTTKDAFSVDDIESTGQLLVADYNKQTQRKSFQREINSFILEF